MARRPSKHLRPARPLSGTFARNEAKADGQWVVQSLPGGRSEKPYTCPGCSRIVAVGAAQVVAWPRVPRLGSSSAVTDRRHWHTACWARKA